MDLLLAVFVGLALSLVVGIRIFTPLLFASIVANFGWVELASGFEWIGSTPTLIVFAIATVIEVVSNYIPFVASLFNVLTTPLAIIAGILLTAAFIGEMNPVLYWTISLVGGGGTAGVTHTVVSAIKGVGSSLTAGIFTPMIALVEDILAFVISLLIFIAPFVALIVVGFLIVLIFRLSKKYLGNKKGRVQVVN